MIPSICAFVSQLKAIVGNSFDHCSILKMRDGGIGQMKKLRHYWAN